MRNTGWLLHSARRCWSSCAGRGANIGAAAQAQSPRYNSSCRISILDLPPFLVELRHAGTVASGKEMSRKAECSCWSKLCINDGAEERGDEMMLLIAIACQLVLLGRKATPEKVPESPITDILYRTAFNQCLPLCCRTFK